MEQKWKKLIKNQRGVTLIELLVVVVILGIIAAVAIPMVSVNQGEAQANTNRHNLNILQDAVQRFSLDNNGNPPANLGELVTGNYINSNPDVAGTDPVVKFDYAAGTGVVSIPAGAPGAP